MFLSPTRFLMAAAASLALGLGGAANAQTTTSTAASAAPTVALSREYPTTTATQLAAAEGTSPTVVRHPSGMVYEVIRPGSGTELTTGATARIHYVLTSDRGDLWDNSRIRTVPRPFKFESMTGAVVQGMHLGTFGMKVGERRLLHVPPELGYGSRQAGGIPPNSWLHFDVELVDVLPPGAGSTQSPDEPTSQTIIP